MKKLYSCLTYFDLSRLLGLKTQELRDILKSNPVLKSLQPFTNLSFDSAKLILSAFNLKYKFKCISFINLKGGVGKTTTAATLATKSLQYAYKSCLIDLDPQGSSTTIFCDKSETELTIFYDLWSEPEKYLPKSLINVESELFLLPSSLENSLLDATLTNPRYQKNALSEVCNVLKNNQFELILVDCPPSLGAAVISTICASDIIVIPVNNDPLSLRGLNFTMTEINSICDIFKLKTPQIKILYTKYDKREKMTFETQKILEKNFRDYLIPHYIKTSTAYSNSFNNNRTIYGSHSVNKSKKDYDFLFKYLLEINI